MEPMERQAPSRFGIRIALHILAALLLATPIGLVGCGGSFGVDNGRDTITDFRSTDNDGVGETPDLIGDKINLAATTLIWTDLDDNILGGDGVLDENDSYVTLINSDTDMVIDLGAADGGTSGINTLTLFDVTSLVKTDFDFANFIDPDALIV